MLTTTARPHVLEYFHHGVLLITILGMAIPLAIPYGMEAFGEPVMLGFVGSTAAAIGALARYPSLRETPGNLWGTYVFALLGSAFWLTYNLSLAAHYQLAITLAGVILLEVVITSVLWRNWQHLIHLVVIGLLLVVLPSDFVPRDAVLTATVQAGNYDHAAYLLSIGANPNARNFNGSALSSAITTKRNEPGNIELVRLLLDSGADPNRATGNFDIPVVIDTIYDHDNSPTEYRAMLELLLERGADPNVRNARGATALEEAVRFGQIDMVELLLRYGADINARGWMGQTPIFNAPTPYLAHYLLEHGAVLDVRDDRGGRPLWKP